MTYKKRNCPWCFKRFMRMQSLIDHMTLRHSKSTTFLKMYLRAKRLGLLKN